MPTSIMPIGECVPPAIFDGVTVPFSVDLLETPDAYLLKAALPGMKPEDIAIDATGPTFTVRPSA